MLRPARSAISLFAGAALFAFDYGYVSVVCIPRMPCLACLSRYTIQRHVFSMGNEYQMLGVYARPVAARMVYIF